MKLRVGSDTLPKDLFQLMLTSDNISELIEAQASSVCKVDFINGIIASELLNIVSNWYEGLKNCPETAPIQKFIRKKGKLFSEIVRYILPVALLSITCLYSNYLLPILGINNELSIESLQKTLVFLVAIFMIGSFVGVKNERFIDERIDKFEGHPRFSITRGDKNAIEEYEKSNNTLIKEIVSRIFWIVFGLLVTSPLKTCYGIHHKSLRNIVIVWLK